MFKEFYSRKEETAMPYGFRVDIQGRYACFSRPELKVERVSYEVMTPSAARGSDPVRNGPPFR